MTFRLLKQRKETRRNEKLYQIFQVTRNSTKYSGKRNNKTRNPGNESLYLIFQETRNFSKYSRLNSGKYFR